MNGYSGGSTGGSRKCLSRFKKRCSCGLFLQGKDGCHQKLLKTHKKCKNVKKKKVLKKYKAYCKTLTRRKLLGEASNESEA
jgi:hypothetical protein